MQNRTNTTETNSIEMPKARSRIAFITIVLAVLAVVIISIITLSREVAPLTQNNSEVLSTESIASKEIETTEQTSNLAATPEPEPETEKSNSLVSDSESNQESLKRLKLQAQQQQTENLKLRERADKLEQELSEKVKGLKSKLETTSVQESGAAQKESNDVIIAEIKRLIDEGKPDMAAAALEQFNSSCPDCSIPEDLQEFSRQQALKKIN